MCFAHVFTLRELAAYGLSGLVRLPQAIFKFPLSKPGFKGRL